MWGVKDYVDQVLQSDLCSVGVIDVNATSIAKKMSWAAMEAVEQIKKDSEIPFKATTVTHAAEGENMKLSLSAKGVTVSLPMKVYNKLKDLSSRHSCSLLHKSGLPTAAFDTAVFTCLLRYLLLYILLP